MRRVLIIVGVIMVCLFIAAVYVPIPRHYNLTVRGKVVDEKGGPIPDAVIGSQIEHRCGTLGGGSTSRAFAKFRTQAGGNGQFELRVHGLYFGYISILGMAGCTTVEDRFACKRGYQPMLEMNYMHPETMPLKGSYDVTYILKRGAPTRAAQLSFMDLAADALRCQEDPKAPAPPVPDERVWSACPQEPDIATSTISGWEPEVKLGARYFCTPNFVPRVQVEAPTAAAFLRLTAISTPTNNQPSYEFAWIPGPRYSESAADAKPFIGSETVELYPIAESNGILRPIGGVRWHYSSNPDLPPAASSLEPVGPQQWPSSLGYARGKLPRDIAKRLSEAALPQ